MSYNSDYPFKARGHPGKGFFFLMDASSLYTKISFGTINAIKKKVFTVMDHSSTIMDHYGMIPHVTYSNLRWYQIQKAWFYFKDTTETQVFTRGIVALVFYLAGASENAFLGHILSIFAHFSQNVVIQKTSDLAMNDISQNPRVKTALYGWELRGSQRGRGG